MHIMAGGALALSFSLPVTGCPGRHVVRGIAVLERLDDAAVGLGFENAARTEGGAGPADQAAESACIRAACNVVFAERVRRERARKAGVRAVQERIAEHMAVEVPAPVC